MLLFSDMLVRYASPSGPMCLRCLMLIRPCGVFAVFYCCLDLCCGECYVGCLQFECFPICVPVCLVCFIFDCIDELFAPSISSSRPSSTLFHKQSITK